MTSATLASRERPPDDLELAQTISWNSRQTQHTSAKLASYLQAVDRADAYDTFIKHGVTDLWFPFPKQTLRQLLKDPHAEKKFADMQEGNYDSLDAREMNPLVEPYHLVFEDGEEVVRSDRILGEGGHGIVEQVTLPTRPQPLVCVRKRIGRPKQMNAQRKLFEAFSREINVMRQVHHRHCVQFTGSYSDYDSVAILSSPVADMDLATFLDLPDLSPAQSDTLHRGLGCLCSALNYLHEKKIR